MKGDKDMIHQLCHKNRSLDISTVDEQNMFYLEGVRVPPNNIHNVQLAEYENALRAEGLAKDILESTDTDRRAQKDFITIMDINDAHDSFGHMDEQHLREFCKRTRIKLTGKFKTCVGCAESKAKRRPVRKVTQTRATEKGERIYVDTSGPYANSLGGHKKVYILFDM